MSNQPLVYPIIHYLTLWVKMSYVFIGIKVTIKIKDSDIHLIHQFISDRSHIFTLQSKNKAFTNLFLKLNRTNLKGFDFVGSKK